jgi:hypothetical protein
MGKIQRMKNKIIVRLGADEILSARIAVEKDHTFTLAELIRWYAEMKAKEKQVELPGGVIATSFDPENSEFIVTFFKMVEDAFSY